MLYNAIVGQSSWLVISSMNPELAAIQHMGVLGVPEEDVWRDEYICTTCGGVNIHHVWSYIYTMAYGAVLSVQYSSFFSLLYTYYVTFTILWLDCPFKISRGDYRV